MAVFPRCSAHEEVSAVDKSRPVTRSEEWHIPGLYALSENVYSLYKHKLDMLGFSNGI